MTISQNHRTAQVGRGLLRSRGLPLQLKHGHLELVAQVCIQLGFAYLQGWRLHNLSGQPVPVLGHPHSKRVFPDVQREPPVFQCVSIGSGPVTGHCRKEPGSVFFIPSCQVFIYINKFPPELSLLEVKQSQLSQPFLI